MASSFGVDAMLAVRVKSKPFSLFGTGEIKIQQFLTNLKD
jgi:hypothetical protein